MNNCKCGGILKNNKRSKPPKQKEGRIYYFNEWNRCNKCKKVFFISSSITYFKEDYNNSMRREIPTIIENKIVGVKKKKVRDGYHPIYTDIKLPIPYIPEPLTGYIYKPYIIK